MMWLTQTEISDRKKAEKYRIIRTEKYEVAFLVKLELFSYVRNNYKQFPSLFKADIFLMKHEKIFMLLEIYFRI